MNALLEKPDTVIPTAEDAALATDSSRILAKLKPETELTVQLENGQSLVLPKAATRLLAYLLSEMAQGNAVTLIPVHAELTTQEAADYLGVSRPFLIAMLEAKTLPFYKVGTHRRIRFTDLKAFKENRNRDRDAAMQELADQAQELEMGY
jgi:excisionase family DNA binding protein